MSTKAPWISQLSLRNKNLSAMEENILRMRFGLRAHALTPVNRSADIHNPQTLQQLSHLEARLRVQASAPGAPMQHRRSPKD